ncbi:nuclear transport factor 2 family protein [Sphingomonas histidinilytica]|uniref:nuclear transport factor 2 family protein n=1 Tax=Rhizorhabdus histidinilytica TaxID=439228 RepID=UPI001AD9BB5A|nr:nuclear transport factor 2 family protein [Rhizorhabdus histidinilytica]MBO9376408.1 nuclear transport factor 2 family protein [Rhizorhabdus histidinilytica]
MQYESALGREQLVDLAIKRYFANVDAKNLDAAMECFHDEALFCVQSAFVRHSGKAEIRRMLGDLMDNYETVVHRDFICTVDEKNGRIAASFEAVLTAADGTVTRLHNTNFWRVRGDKFQEVYVYMSGANPLI